MADLLRARPSRTSIRESDAGREIEPARAGSCGHSLSARISRHRHGLRFWCWSRRTGAAALRVAGDAVARPAAGVDRAALYRCGALARAVVMAGAMERALDTAVTYAGERKQFGRPIGKFQAVQQNHRSTAPRRRHRLPRRRRPPDRPSLQGTAQSASPRSIRCSSARADYGRTVVALWPTSACVEICRTDAGGVASGAGGAPHRRTACCSEVPPPIALSVRVGPNTATVRSRCDNRRKETFNLRHHLAVSRPSAPRTSGRAV